MRDREPGPVSRGGIAPSRCSRRRRAARLVSRQLRQPADLGRIAGPARRVFARLRRGRLALHRQHRLADFHRARGRLARDRVRPAPRARHSEPRLRPGLAGDPVRPRLPHADRAQHRPRHAARHVRARDVDDRVPQSADPLVAAGDRDLFDPGRLRARYRDLARSASTSTISDGSGCTGRAWWSRR